MIKGGYYIIARQINDSKIAHMPPPVRETWDYLLMNANHKSVNNIKRGQLVSSLKEIIDAKSWYIGYRKEGYTRKQIRDALRYFEEENMIEVKRVGRENFLITIGKYSYFQDPKNYKEGGSTKVTTKVTLDACEGNYESNFGNHPEVAESKGVTEKKKNTKVTTKVTLDACEGNYEGNFNKQEGKKNKKSLSLLKSIEGKKKERENVFEIENKFVDKIKNRMLDKKFGLPEKYILDCIANAKDDDELQQLEYSLQSAEEAIEYYLSKNLEHSPYALTRKAIKDKRLPSRNQDTNEEKTAPSKDWKLCKEPILESKFQQFIIFLEAEFSGFELSFTNLNLVQIQNKTVFFEVRSEYVKKALEGRQAFRDIFKNIFVGYMFDIVVCENNKVAA